MKTIQKVGWIGLGTMGQPMALKILAAGYSLHVHNRTRDKEQALLREGAQSSSSPVALLEQTEVVFIMVSDDAATAQVFNGPDGLLTGKHTNRIIVNMSTVSPDISRQLAQQCQAQGLTYLDAPVSGSVKQVQEAALVVMAGGDESQLKLVKPLLQCFSRHVMHLGENGKGNALKLAVNTFLGIVTLGLAETANFALASGLQMSDLLTVLNNSALQSPYIKIKGDALLQEQYQAAFPLKHLDKDLRLARENGLATPLGLATGEVFQQAEQDYGMQDVIAVMKYLKATPGT